MDFFWFAIFVSTNGLIIVALASLVSWRRIRLRVPHGDGGLIPMKQAIRAHGNAAEHVPLMGLIVLALCAQQADQNLVAALVLGFTVSRLLHPLGMLGTAFWARRLGATPSYLAETIGAIAAFAVALS